MGLACEDGMRGSQARQSVRQLTGAGKGMGESGEVCQGARTLGHTAAIPWGGGVLPEWKKRKRRVLWVKDLGV